MGAAEARQLVLRVSVAAASWEVFSSAVRVIVSPPPPCCRLLISLISLTASQRRVQRAAEVEAIKAMAHDGLQEDELMSEDGAVSDEPESEEGVDSNDDAAAAVVATYRERGGHEPQSIKVDSGGGGPDPTHGERHNGHVWVPSWHSEDDGDLDRDGHPAATKPAYGTTRRTRPVGLADLDSPSGRCVSLSPNLKFDPAPCSRMM